MKIVSKDDKLITLEELFKAKEESQFEMANLSFKEKIRILVDLQKLAYSWGGRKDIKMWQ